MIEGGVGAAAVLYRHGNERASLHKHLGRAEHHTIYEAELTGILLALQLIRIETPYRSTLIALDNVAAIQATKIAKSSPGSYLVDAIHDMVEREFEDDRHRRPTLCWVPGHVDIEGNERSNEEAKAAARGHMSADAALPEAIRGQLPFSWSAARQRFNEGLKKRWKELLEQSPRWQKLKRIDPTAPSNRFRKITSSLPRRHVATLIQLCTGHAPLQHHLHRIQPDEFESPTCPACGQCDETVAHFLLECQCYADSRHRLEQAVGRSSRNLAELLSNPSMFKHLFEFIHKTQRFKKTFSDLNLPKTAETELDEPRGRDMNCVHRAQTSTTRTHGGGEHRGLP